MSRSSWILVGCVLLPLGLVGCSSDDVAETLGIDTEGPVAEAAIENVLVDVVEPLVTVQELVQGFVGLAPASAFAGRVPACPPTGSVCSSGAVTCTPTATGLDFQFSMCSATDGSSTVTINGGVGAALGATLEITLSNLQIDGGPGLYGTMDVSGCNTVWDVNADDGTVVAGSFTACASQNPQPGGNLTIRFQDDALGLWVMTITFDGSATANAAITLEGAPYANCTVDLNTFDAICTGV